MDTKVESVVLESDKVLYNTTDGVQYSESVDGSVFRAETRWIPIDTGTPEYQNLVRAVHDFQRQVTHAVGQL